LIGKEVAHYKILDRLGSGGMGVVYKAEDTRLGRAVALKFLNPELLSNQTVRKRFFQEARAASIIDHPNVCHVYEVAETDGLVYMAMNYCEGQSLNELIKTGPVPPPEAFSIAFGVAQGLWAAHRRGIVHRDVKPANIMLSDDGFVRIVDFGLALLVGDTRVTTSGVTVGTVAYMSPEQTSDAEVAANTDIWSLGVTLYEMLAGRHPFHGEVSAALVYSIVHEPHTRLRELNPAVPAECARIVDRCLEKDPAQRYPTIEALLEDMVKVAHELGWESRVASATIAPILRERRRKVFTRRAAVTAMMLLVLAGGALAWKKFHVHSPYTTKIRLAVLPLNNMIGADSQTFVDGLSEHIARVTRWVAHDHPSMWTVPYISVLNADLPNPVAAGPAFGANRAVTGDVQRFEGQYRVRLRLVDTKRGRELKSIAVPFRMDSMQGLPDTLRILAASLCGTRTDARPSPWICHDAQAAADYFENLSRVGAKDAKTLGDAVSVLDQSVARDSTFAALVCADGNARMQLYRKKHDRAALAGTLALGRRAHLESPAFADASVLMGDAFGGMEVPDSAEACFKRALAVEPDLLAATQRLAKLYEAQKRTDEAEQAFIDLTRVRPDQWAPHSNLGTFYFNQERLDDAAAAYRTALELAPADPRTLNNLGAVYHRRGQWAQARALFLRSFQARPNYESSNNVAVAYYFDGNFDESSKYFEFALQYSDTTTHAPWGDLARALYWTESGRPRSIRLYGKALGLAESALSRAPDDVELMSYVIDYQAMVEKADSARVLIERIKPLLKDNEVAIYRVGAVEEKLGNREAALDLIGDAVRHGFPVAELRGDPMLKSLVSDSRFKQMVSTEAAADGAQAAKSPH
jgi:serine/threonine-protein kinase